MELIELHLMDDNAENKFVRCLSVCLKQLFSTPRRLALVSEVPGEGS